MKDAKCIDIRGVYLGTALPNVASDFAIVIMPMPYVWRLNAPIGQRLAFVGLFALGFFVCIVSILRLMSTIAIDLKNQDATYQLRYFLLWSVVEINVGLVCACLPSMKPLFRLLGLGRIFVSWSRPGQPVDTSGTINRPPGIAWNDAEQARGRRRESDLFSTIRDLASSSPTTRNPGDDEMEMIDRIFTKHGETTAQVEAINECSDTDHNSRDTSERGSRRISIRRDWSVFTE